MSTVKPYFPLINDPDNSGKRIRSTKPLPDTWLLRWKNHQGIMKTKVFHGSRKDSEKALQKIVVETDQIRQGLKPAPEKTISFHQAIQLYITHLSSCKYPQATIDRYNKTYRVFKSFLKKDVLLSEINRREIETFRDMRIQKCTQSGVNIDLRQLKVFFNWCVAIEYIQKSPFIGIKIGSAEKQVRILSHSELNSLFTVISDSNDQDIWDLVNFYLLTGVRTTEILPPRFTWENVKEDEIVIVGKRKKIHHIPINATMRLILERRRSLQYPFPYNYYQVYRQIVRHYFKEAGILNANIHSLRKTAGYLLIESGVDIYRVSKFLNHSSVTTTEKHYVDILKKDFRAISVTLENKVKIDTQMIRKNGTKSDQISADMEAAEGHILGVKEARYNQYLQGIS
ncbi:MAG: tyrosine-type recombinase/integrase [Candidatus Neomarinimicrobiota bacterium]|jgi:integrase